MTSYIHTHNAGIDSYLFSNGFKLILAHYPGAPKARVELVVRVGSKNEGYGETGMAHLLEHMLFKSTSISKDVKASLTALSSEWNGFTSTDSTNYYEVVSPDKVLEALQLERHRLLDATFTQEDLSTEMTVVRNEMDRAASDSNQVMRAALMRATFDWHGYGRSTLGSPSDVEDAPFAALRAFYKKHYNASNAFLLLTGNFDRVAVLDYVSLHFGSLPKHNTQGIVTTSWTVEGEHRGGAQRDVLMPMNKVQTWLGWRMPPMFSRQAVALQLAMHALGSYERGVLRKELVIETKQLVDVHCMPNDMLDGGIVIVAASGQQDDNVHELARVVEQSIYAHLAKGISEQDLEDTRQDELAQYHAVLSSWENLTYILVDAELQGDWQWAFERKTMVQSVAYEEMMQAARTWIVPDAQTTVRLHDGTPKAPALFKIANPQTFASFDNIVLESDAVASSYAELADQQMVWQADSHLRLALSRRNTQAGYVYIQFDNTLGNDSARAEHFFTAKHAQELRDFGGFGRNQKALSAWLNANKAELEWRESGFYLRVPPAQSLSVLRDVLDVFHAPEFSREEFEAFKESKLTRIKGAMAKVEAQVSNQLGQPWANYPTGHWAATPTLQASYVALENLQYADALASLAWMSQRGRARLSVVGACEKEDIDVLARDYTTKYAADIHSEHTYLTRPDFDEHLSAGVPIVIELGNSPNAMVAGLCPLRMNSFHPDAPALSLALQVLGGDTMSRLWMRIREQGGMAYHVRAGLQMGAKGLRTSLSMVSSCSVDQMNDVHAAMVQEWDRFLQGGITQEELDHAKEQHALRHQESIQNDENYVDVYHNAPMTLQDYTWRATVQKKEQQMTLEDVNAAIGAHLVGAPVQWALGRSVRS